MKERGRHTIMDRVRREAPIFWALHNKEAEELLGLEDALRIGITPKDIPSLQPPSQRNVSQFMKKAEEAGLVKPKS